MATTMLQEPSSEPDFMFRCQFLGTRMIMSEAVCSEALRKFKALAESVKSRCEETRCNLHITKTEVFINEEETGGEEHIQFISRISFITQDPGEKTVFGYLYSPDSFRRLRDKLYVFKSNEADVIIKILREYKGLSNNNMREVAGSLDGAKDLFQNVTLEKMSGMTQQLENVQNQSQRKDYECSKLQEKSQKLQNEVDEMRRQKEIVETQLRQMEQQLLLERNRVEVQNQRLREMEQQLAQSEKSSYDWIISCNEVQVTDKSLGSGGWGTVYEGRYCGCAVAVKQIKEDFAPASCLKMFQREIDMASKCRHPCLLQFIGATVDGGFPLLVTELMETSLRRLLVERPLSIGEAFIISLDVARALNYLHQKRPVPMIHRDISSANVLLWRKAGREEGIQEAQWRGKVSDYGTAKFVEQVMTQTPGCLAYSAPEARTTTQTAKMDVYSFGVLLCEMCIQDYPEPGRRDVQVDKMSNRALKGLVRHCLQTNPNDRPDMTEIIGKLEQF